MRAHPDAFHLLETSIDDVRAALAARRITSVELVARYLARIGAFDRAGARLCAIPVLNPEMFADAAESDRRWRDGTARALEGVPFTVKDSYMVRGLTVASGSPAFSRLIAQRDAFSVEKLREAGAVLIGKTNMPPMADGGMQRGLYGRAESPYNPHFLAAAYASGSSNGSAVSTAANMAVFGMGEETVSSGRSPASNNGLCAYTPSWGILSIRGNWPLFPARDVVVPHTRSMPDMLRLLDVLVQDDAVTRGDFWRHQQVVPVPLPSEHRPDSYFDLQRSDALAGVRLGVPKMYLGMDHAFPIDVRPSILERWQAARVRLEALGAEVIEVDFPVVEQYEGGSPGGEEISRLGVLPEGWMDTEFTDFLAFGWDDFLRANGDPSLPSLASVDPDTIFPAPPGSLEDRYGEVEDYPNRYRAVVQYAKEGIPDPRERADFADGVRAIVQLRKKLFEDWLAERGLDAVVFPANADVGAANADIDRIAADHAWANGVFFSNGNYALRHFGIPSVTVSMGQMSDIAMPIGLTFAGAAYTDPALLSFAAAFESGTVAEDTDQSEVCRVLRPVPSFAPELPADRLKMRDPQDLSQQPPALTLEAVLDPDEYHEGARLLLLTGTVTSGSSHDGADSIELTVTVNGSEALAEVSNGRWSATVVLPAAVMPPEVGGNPSFGRALVVAVASGPGGAAAAFVNLR